MPINQQKLSIRQNMSKIDHMKTVSLKEKKEYTLKSERTVVRILCSYFSKGEYLEMEIKQRIIIKMDELPKGFFYFTDDYMVEGTGKLFVKEKENERVHSKKRKQVFVHS